MRPASITQSSTRLTMGTLPTGIRALDATFVPSLNGYKLAVSSFRAGRAGNVPFTVTDENDSDEVLGVHHPALRYARWVEEALRRHDARW